MLPRANSRRRPPMLSRARGSLAWVAEQLPAVLVLVVLVSLGVWGARNDWSLPSSLRPKQEQATDKKDEKDEPDDPTQSPKPIVLDSDEAARLAGVALGESSQKTVAEEVEAPAVLAFDLTRYAHLAPRAAGTVWRIFRWSTPGAQVRR